MRALPAAAFVVATLMTLGCGGISTPSSNVTDTFSGTLQFHGSNGHPFSVSNTGEFTVKLTQWGPNSGILVGIAWTTGDGVCATSGVLLQQNTFAALNAQALNGSIVSGKYCIFIFDVGTMTAAQTYTMTVSHPG